MVDVGAGKIQPQLEDLRVINGKISSVLIQTIMVFASVLINIITTKTQCV